mmetsp:Transcript_143786/g.254043  ORF Transcript_143786/g.254043 Transcript_143786/m.254043 type:complete len:204 (-) Transcript_143786:841-1452(-)
MCCFMLSWFLNTAIWKVAKSRALTVVPGRRRMIMLTVFSQSKVGVGPPSSSGLKRSCAYKSKCFSLMSRSFKALRTFWLCRMLMNSCCEISPFLSLSIFSKSLPIAARTFTCRFFSRSPSPVAPTTSQRIPINMFNIVNEDIKTKRMKATSIIVFPELLIVFVQYVMSSRMVPMMKRLRILFAIEPNKYSGSSPSNSLSSLLP